MFKIRYMTKEDLEQVFALDKEAFPTQWPPTNYRSELQNRLAHYMVVYIPGEKEEDPQEQKPPRGFIPFIKSIFGAAPTEPTSDTIVGFAGCWIMADETHITEIATRQQYRSQGIGHLLLVSLIELGIRYKANVATLEVRVSNKSAQLLYEKFGFENVGVRKAYYSDNKEDAYIMTTPDVKAPEYQQKLAQLKQELIDKWKLQEFPQVEGPDASSS